MQYMLLIYADPSVPPRSEAEHDALSEDFMAFTNDLRSRGVYVAGDPLAPTSSATTVRVRDGSWLSPTVHSPRRKSGWADSVSSRRVRSTTRSR
jgi:hypothetical protein